MNWFQRFLQLFRGRPAPAVNPARASLEEAAQTLGRAQRRATATQRLEDAVGRATGRMAAQVQYWNCAIPRPDPGRNLQEITELRLKVREAGMLAEAAQLELESDKRILKGAKGLKSLADGIEKTKKENVDVRKQVDEVRDEILKAYPSTD
ncbi:MAG: hypothetical protein PHE52_01525 [Candidatus Pacebacteria bacterium]|nr:hypothetical protein [Candidatus Paceibacterota bacterium]